MSIDLIRFSDSILASTNVFPRGKDRAERRGKTTDARNGSRRYTIETPYQSVGGIQTARNAVAECSKCRETADRKRRESNPSNGLAQLGPLLRDSWNHRRISTRDSPRRLSSADRITDEGEIKKKRGWVAVSKRGV